MNAHHLHLILNHFPLVLLLAAVPILVVGYLRKHLALEGTAHLLLVAAALFALGAYLTGEGAEHVVEDQVPGAGRWVHTHEEAAVYALAWSLVAGVLAGLRWVLRRSRLSRTWVWYLLLVVLAFNATSLAVTGYLGGQIRHTELRDGAQTSGSNDADPHEESPEKHD